MAQQKKQKRLPIIQGIGMDAIDFIYNKFPQNMLPVLLDNGISSGYMKPVEGFNEAYSYSIVNDTNADYAAHVWKEDMYRVRGNTVVKYSGSSTRTVLGVLGASGTINSSITHGFDHIVFTNGLNLYTYDGTTFTSVSVLLTGACHDVCFIEGYYVSTDGDFLVVSDINDPTSWSPTKYGASEADPDKIIRVLNINNELVAVNRYSIEYFDNVGGTGFPFQRVDSAKIMKGAFEKASCCRFMDYIALIGGSEGHAMSIWLCSHGVTENISSPFLERVIEEYERSELQGTYYIKMEWRHYNGEDLLYLHCKTLDYKTSFVYSRQVSLANGKPIWSRLKSPITLADSGFPKNLVNWRSDWYGGADANYSTGKFLVKMSETTRQQLGGEVTYILPLIIDYEEGISFTINDIELVCRIDYADGSTYLQLQETGFTWDDDPYPEYVGYTRVTPPVISPSTTAPSEYRLKFFQQAYIDNYRTYEFTWDSGLQLSAFAVIANIEVGAW